MASLVVAGDTSGSVTLAAPAISGSTTLTLPTTTGTLVVTSGAQTIEFADGSASAPSITNSGDTNTGIFFPAADTIAFGEGGAEAMRINSSGNLLVGGTTGTAAGKLTVTTANAGYVAVEPTSSVTSQIATGLRLHGNINETDRYVGIFCLNGAANNVNDMTFWTTSSGVSGERARITSGGNLLVGKTAATGTTQGIFLQADGIYGFTKNESGTGPLGYFVNANGTVDNGYRFASFRVTGSFTEVGTITTNGSSSTAYNTSSDYRLKENVAPMQNALNVVAQLKPCTYTWKANGSAGQGFIAHELQAVVPDCVTGEKDAVETYTDEEGNDQTRPVYQGIDTSFLVATLTAAIQEQQAIITDLKARIETLENK